MQKFLPRRLSQLSSLCSGSYNHARYCSRGTENGQISNEKERKSPDGSYKDFRAERFTRRSLSPAARLGAMLSESKWESIDPLDELKKSEKYTDAQNEDEKESSFSQSNPNKTAQYSEEKTLEQFLLSRGKRVWRPSPKVLQMMLSCTGVGSGDVVIEAGTGQGINSLLLSKTVGSKGQVHTVDVNDDISAKAQNNFKMWTDCFQKQSSLLWPQNVYFYHFHINSINQHPGIPEDVDMVYLDLTNPAGVVLEVLKKLKQGKCFVVYSPSPTKIIDLMDVVEEECLPLVVEGIWEESNMYISLHSVPGDGKKYLKELGSHRTDENDTAFFVKMRLVDAEGKYTSKLWHNTSRSQRKFEISQGKGNKFERELSDLEGKKVKLPKLLKEKESVIVTPIVQPKEKKGQRKSILVALEADERHNNDWGTWEHNAVIGQPEGAVINTSSGRQVYVTRPGLEEWAPLYSTTNKNIRPLQARVLHLMCHSLDVLPGASVLHLSDIASLFPLFASKAVGPHGKVYNLADIEDGIEVSRLQDNVIKDWNQIQESQGEHCENNITSLPHSHLTSQDLTFDKLSIISRSASLLRLLDLSFSLLNDRARISVLCTSLSQVQNVIKWANSKQDITFDPNVIRMDRQREWIIKPSKQFLSKKKQTEATTESGDGTKLPYICRPKHAASPLTGYYVAAVRKDSTPRQDEVQFR